MSRTFIYVGVSTTKMKIFRAITSAEDGLAGPETKPRRSLRDLGNRYERRVFTHNADLKKNCFLNRADLSIRHNDIYTRVVVICIFWTRRGGGAGKLKFLGPCGFRGLAGSIVCHR